MAERPIIVFDGNCQAQHLAAIFAGAGLAESYAVGDDLGFVPSYRGAIPRSVSPDQAYTIVATARQAGRTVFQSAQLALPAGRADALYTPLCTAVARHPNLESYAGSPAAFVARYGAARPAREVFALDLEIVGLGQRLCGSPVDFAAVMRAEMPRRPLFHSVGHPGGLLTSLMFRSVAEQLGFDAAAVERVEQDLRDAEGINFDSEPGYPVEQDVLDALGFVWPDWYPAYRAMLTLGKAGAHRDWLARRHDFERLFARDTLFWRYLAEAAVGVGDTAVAAGALERLTAIAPGWTPGWSRRFHFWHGQQDHAAAARVVEAMRAFFGEHRHTDGLLAGVAFTERRKADAIAHARRFSDKTVTKAEGHVLVIAFLLWSGLRDQAMREAVAAAASFTRRDRDIFSARLKFFGLELNGPDETGMIREDGRHGSTDIAHAAGP